MIWLIAAFIAGVIFGAVGVCWLVFRNGVIGGNVL